jgi:hypothetical protein
MRPTVIALRAWDVGDTAACVDDCGVCCGRGPQQQLGIEVPAAAQLRVSLPTLLTLLTLLGHLTQADTYDWTPTSSSC